MESLKRWREFEKFDDPCHYWTLLPLIDEHTVVFPMIPSLCSSFCFIFHWYQRYQNVLDASWLGCLVQEPPLRIAQPPWYFRIVRPHLTIIGCLRRLAVFRCESNHKILFRCVAGDGCRRLASGCQWHGLCGAHLLDFSCWIFLPHDGQSWGRRRWWWRFYHLHHPNLNVAVEPYSSSTSGVLSGRYREFYWQ